MAPLLARARGRQGGQSLIEYTLILVLVAVVVIAVLGLLGRQILDAFQNVANTMRSP